MFVYYLLATAIDSYQPQYVEKEERAYSRRQLAIPRLFRVVMQVANSRSALVAFLKTEPDPRISVRRPLKQRRIDFIDRSMRKSLLWIFRFAYCIVHLDHSRLYS